MGQIGHMSQKGQIVYISLINQKGLDEFVGLGSVLFSIKINSTS